MDLLTSAQNPLSMLAIVQTVGLCGEAKFNGRTSSGGASRALSAVWGVSAEEGTSSSALDAVYSALAPFNGSLIATLNVTALEVGTVFTLSLSVENFFGATDEATASVTRT